MLDWHFDCVVLGGAAGTIFFSWTDEWFTGGHEIEDWEFGLVTRDRKPKKAYHVLKAKLNGDGAQTERVKLKSYPMVSIIVCSYTAARRSRIAWNRSISSITRITRLCSSRRLQG